MQNANSLIQSTLLVLALWTSFAWTNQATAARYVEASITRDGITLLKGSTGDNGRVDADGVWEYLKSIKFKATEDFRRLNVAPDAKETILTSDAPTGQPGTIILDIRYGGKAITRKLKLVRVPIDEYGSEWSLDAAQVDKLFEERLIRRSDAAQLENPRNSKR
jgi:hypothetical protein